MQDSQPTIKPSQSLRDDTICAPVPGEETADRAGVSRANRISPVNENPVLLTDVPDGGAFFQTELPKADVRLTVVLDTSVLIADPSSIHGYGECDVVLPLTVIEELDGHKTRRDDVGQAALEALRTIEVLRNAHDGDIRTAVPLSNGGTVRVETNGVISTLFAPLGSTLPRPTTGYWAPAAACEMVVPRCKWLPMTQRCASRRLSSDSKPRRMSG